MDFICGGPPCQGISGFNRFRDKEDPLKDPKNHQLVVYMDIIAFLKPRHILMENVVDIVKFAGGYLISYAFGRLVSMNYQARLGIMAAGSYGVAQCRMRIFLWGANSMEASSTDPLTIILLMHHNYISNFLVIVQNLPHFPLPTHELVGRGVVTNEFKVYIFLYIAVLFCYPCLCSFVVAPRIRQFC